MAARFCEVCEKEIGEHDKVCPSCGTDLEGLEEEVSVVTRAMSVAEKRKKKKEAEEEQPSPAPTPEANKGGFFSSLAMKRSKK